LMPAEF